MDHEQMGILCPCGDANHKNLKERYGKYTQINHNNKHAAAAKNDEFNKVTVKEKIKKLRSEVIRGLLLELPDITF